MCKAKGTVKSKLAYDHKRMKLVQSLSSSIFQGSPDHRLSRDRSGDSPESLLDFRHQYFGDWLLFELFGDRICIFCNLDILISEWCLPVVYKQLFHVRPIPFLLISIHQLSLLNFQAYRALLLSMLSKKVYFMEI